MTRYEGDSRDPGLAAERTDLAWNRSGLSLLACGTAILRGIGRIPLVKGSAAVGVSVLVLGAAAWALGGWHAWRSKRRRDRATTAADLLPVAMGVAALGLAAFALAAFAPS
jgi:uncharacterized membrane protein YidH (DUF202 family)